ncbi:MAG: ABC transporter substrate-binding protein [Chloroflexota bacterium]
MVEHSRIAGQARKTANLVTRLGVACVMAGVIIVMPNNLSIASKQSVTLPTLRLQYMVGREALPASLGPPQSLAISLDPPFAHNLKDFDTNSLTNANLVRTLPNDRVGPDLATWTLSKDGLVYTFTIRRNARFSNGHDVTATDAAFSIERALSPATSDSDLASPEMSVIRGYRAFRAGKTKTLAGVRVVNRRTLQISLTRPEAYFLAVLTLNAVFDPKVVAGKPLGTLSHSRHDSYLTSTCSANQGAGPFKFLCRNGSSTPGSFYAAGHTPTYTFVPNPYYYGPKAHIKLELPALKDEYKSYLQGNLDGSRVPEVYLSQWQGKSSQYHQYPSSAVHYLFPNVKMPPFDDVHCRLAVAYALDRNTLANNIAGGIRRPTYAIVPREMLGYYAGKDNPHYAPSRARIELAKCPSRTVPFEVVYGTGPLNDNEFPAIRNMLTAVGMNAKLKPVSERDWLTIINQPLDKTKTQIVSYGWTQDYSDPNDYFTYVLPPTESYNLGGWLNADYSRLIKRAAVISNRKVRAKLYIQAQHLALSQGAIIPLSTGTNSFLIKPYVHGLVSGPPTINLVAKNGDWANVSISPH